MIKVLHIAESMYGGGAENVFYQTVKTFKELDFPELCHYIASIPKEAQNIKPDLAFKPSKSKWAFTHSQIYSYQNYKRLKQYLQLVNPDIIHIQLFGELSPSILRAIYKYKKQRRTVKIVQTVHTFEHVCAHHAGYDFKKDKRCLDCIDQRYKIKIFARGCSRNGGIHSLAKGLVSFISDYYYNKRIIDKWIVPSDFLGKLLIKRYKDERKVQVIKNGVISRITPASRSKQNFVIYFGRISEEKNVKLFLHAIPLILKQTADVKFRIIGDGPAKDELIQLVKTLRIEDKVEFYPFMNSEELGKFISDAKVSVLPSKFYETFALVIYESVLAGLLPVAPHHGPIPEGIDWLGAGMTFESDNEVDLAAKVLEALTCYDTKVDSINRSANKVKDHLNYKNYVNLIKDIYIDLINTDC